MNSPRRRMEAGIVWVAAVLLVLLIALMVVKFCDALRSYRIEHTSHSDFAITSAMTTTNVRSDPWRGR